jgi:hypothetical protein
MAAAIAALAASRNSLTVASSSSSARQPSISFQASSSVSPKSLAQLKIA